MELLEVILFIALRITAVQPKIVSILDNLYEINVSKTFYKVAPRYIDVGRDSNVTLYTVDEGYKFTGDHFKEFETVRGYQPNIKDKFVDEFGNTLDCTTQNTQFILKTHKSTKTFRVNTRDSPYNILCLIYRTKCFVIGGKTQDATRGKLYVFDTQKGLVRNQEVITQEIASVGDNITAIASRKGKLLLTQAVAADRKAFNIIFLTPIKKNEEFKYAIKEGLENITDLLERNTQTRLSQLTTENAKLREFLDIEFKKIKTLPIVLPLRGYVSSGLYGEDLQAAVKETEVELLRIQKLNVLGVDDQRYLILKNQTKRSGIFHVSEINSGQVACDYWIYSIYNKSEQAYSCAPTSKFEDRRKLMVASEKIFLEISEWLHTHNDVRWGLIGAVNILGHDYEINVPQAYYTDAPNFIQFNVIGNLIVFIKNKAYNIGSHFQYSWKPYLAPDVDPKIRHYFTDVFGNVLNCTGGNPTFWHKEHRSRYPISIGESKFAFRCYIDNYKNISFILGSEGRNTNKGKLYVVDTTEIDIDKGNVLSREITKVGNNITAITTHSGTGVILLSEEVVIAGSKAFNVIELKPISDEMITFEMNNLTEALVTTITEKAPKIYSTYALDKDDFTNTVKEMQETIIEIHKNTWESRAAQLIEEHKDLWQLAEILLQYYQKINDSSSAGKLSVVISETEIASMDSFNDPLKDAVQKTGDAIVHIYNKDAELSDAALDVIPITKICIPRGGIQYEYIANEMFSCALTDEWRKNERFHDTMNKFYVEIMHYDNNYVEFPFEI